MTKKTDAIKWAADNPTRKLVADLIPYARNSRTHSAEQISQIAASIKEWGFTNPILIDPDGGIIAGHGRLLAAQQLKIKEIPCIVATGWTEAQKKAYVIADNKLALNAGWDNELLKVEFGDLESLGFGLELTGFTLNEISGLNPDVLDQDSKIITDDNKNFMIVCEFEDELSQQQFFEEMLDKAKPIIDQFPANYSYDDCAQLLNGAGLTQVPCWIRPAGTLSNGQQARAEIALQIAQDNPVILIDEFTSTVDRTIAKIMASTVQKIIRKTNKKIILLSCHYDIIE